MSDIVPIAKLKSFELVKSNPDMIIDHIANGGSLTNLAKMIKCDYSEIMKLIRSDESLHKRYMAALEDRKEWAKERIFEELKYMSAYNIQDAVRPDGTLKTIQELPEDLARSIKEVDADGGLKFSDKLKALDQKQKLLGISTEKIEITGKLTLEDLIKQSMKEEEDVNKTTSI